LYCCGVKEEMERNEDGEGEREEKIEHRGKKIYRLP
jgi:hypothetical protein